MANRNRREGTKAKTAKKETKRDKRNETRMMMGSANNTKFVLLHASYS